MGKKELISEIQRKEVEIIGEEAERGKVEVESIVDEGKVNEAIGAIETRLEKSPLSAEFKKKVAEEIKKSTDSWEERVKEFKTKQNEKFEEKFKLLFGKILENFRNFENKPEVKETFESIEPLFENKAGVQQIIDLESYKRRSGDWKKMNARLALFGFNADKISSIQKLLGVVVDGKVGPQTINAINKNVYEEKREIKWSDESTVHKSESPEEFNLRAEEAEKIINSKGWKDIEVKTQKDLEEIRKKQEKAKTVADLEKFEKEESQAKEANRKARKEYIATFSAAKVLEPEAKVPKLGAEAAKPEAKPEEKKEELEVIEVPENFKGLNRRLGLSEKTLAIYYKAYSEGDPGKKIPVPEINAKLEELFNEFSKSVDKSAIRRALIEAFGKLINGQRENLASNEVLSLSLVQIEKKLQGFSEELQKEQKKRARIEKFRKGQIEYLGKLVKENPSWYQAFTPTKEPHITQAIYNLKGLDEKINEIDSGISEINNKIQNLSVSSFINQYQLLKNNGASTKDFLLSVHDALGENAPDSLKPDIHDAREKIVNLDPNASEFDKLFYAEKYSEALKLLAKQNEERTTQFGFGKHDIVNAYRQGRNSDEVKKLTSRFKKGNTYATKKIEEGYVPIPLRKRGEEVLHRVTMVKKQSDGSFHYLWINSDGSQYGSPGTRNLPFVRAMRKGQTLSPEEIEKIDKEDLEMKERMSKIIAHSPNFKAVKEAGAELNKIFAPLQSLFQQALEGNKTVDFVNLLKGQATKIKSSDSIKKLRSSIKGAKAELILLQSFVETGFKDEFEQKITKLEKDLSKVTHVVEGNNIESFCDHILSSDFAEDTFLRWLVTDAISFLTTILVATAAVVLTVSSFGLGGPAALALVAGSGALGGVIGHEIGTVGSHYIGKAIYGDEFSNKTLLGKYLTGEKVYNQKTGQYEEIDGSNLALIYGEQLLTGFVTTFALLGAGQFVGKFLSRFANKFQNVTGFKGMAARTLGKIPRLSRQKVDLLNQKGFGVMMKKLGREFLEETREETMEAVAEKGHSALGFLASLYSCLNGRAVEYKLGEFSVVAEGAKKVGENIAATTWSFDATKSESFLASLQAEYGEQNVDPKGDGTIVVTRSVTLTEGKVMQNIMTFKSTNESLTMRQMLTEGKDPEGKSEIERFYGVKQVSENEYQFGNISPEGKITLIKFLQRRGFIISVDPEQGTFKAVKGEEVVNFKVEPGAGLEEAKTELKKVNFRDRISAAGRVFHEDFVAVAGAMSAFGAGALGGAVRGLERGFKEIFVREKIFKPGRKITYFSLGKMHHAEVVKVGKIKVVGGKVKNAVYLREGGEVVPMAREALVEYMSKAEALDKMTELKELSLEDKEMLIELFPEGIEVSHFKQQNVGDCYLLASMHSVKRHPLAAYLFSKIVKKDGENWIVTFTGEEPIIIAPSDLESQQVWDTRMGDYEYKLPVRGQLGDIVLERAFGKLRKRKLFEAGKMPRKQETRAVLSSGWMSEPLGVFLKGLVKKEIDIYKGYGPLVLGGRKIREMGEDLLNDFAKNPRDYVVTVSTPADFKTDYRRITGGEFGGRYKYYMDPNYRFVQNHAYSVVSVDAGQRTVTIANPHDTRGKEITIPYDKFFRYFHNIQGVKLDPKKLEGIDFMKKDYIKGVYDRKLLPSIANRYNLSEGGTIYLSSFPVRVSFTQDGVLWLDLESGTSIASMAVGQSRVIGRENYPSLRSDSTISGTHVRIENLGNGNVLITDLKSTNGTTVIKTEAIKPFRGPEKVPKVYTGKLEVNKNYTYSLGEINGTLVFGLGPTFGIIARKGRRGAIEIDFSNGRSMILHQGESRLIGRDVRPSEIIADVGTLPESVSRRHMILKNVNGRLVVKDLGSTFGTKVKIVK